MSSGFPWGSLAAAGSGAFVGAALGAALNYWFNRKLETQRKRDSVALFRKKAELSAYQPVREALKELHESVNELAALYLLLKQDLEHYGVLEAEITKFKPPLEANQADYVGALRERQASLDWRKVEKEVDTRLGGTRAALVRFMQQYGSHRVLFQDLWPGVKDLHREVEVFTDSAYAMQQVVFLGMGSNRSQPEPGRHSDLIATLAEMHVTGWNVGLYVDDMSRVFQNMVLGDVAGRMVPYRTCKSPMSKLITAVGLKTATEAGAPIEERDGQDAA
jgi:hypothetical protein